MSDYLLPEVVTEILTRVPVEYLLRCRCVCKEWCSLISSPDFMKKQLSHSSSSAYSHALVRHYSKLRSKEIYTVYDDETFNPENGTQIRFPFRSESGYYQRIVGYCNGLLCLSDDLFGYRETIILWNPSIKRALTLPTPRVLYDRSGPYTFALGFGFVSETNDYKVVRVAYLLPDHVRQHVLPPKVEVFSLSTGVWRRVRNNVNTYITDHIWSQVFIHGAVHWAGYKMNRNRENGAKFRNVMLKFDLNSEEFVEWALPEDLNSGAFMVPTDIYATTVEGYLSVLYTDVLSNEHRGNINCDVPTGFFIWVMKDYGKVESWTPAIYVSLDLGVWTFLSMKSDRDVFFSSKSGELVSYNDKNKTVTGTGISGTKYSFFVDKYVESLALLGMGEEVRGKREPEPDSEDEDEGVEKAECDFIMGACTHTLASIMFSEA